MPWKLDDKIISEGQSWVDKNKIRHPTNWAIWTDDQKKAVGLKWEDKSAQEAPYDNKFYWGRKVNGDLIEKKLADEDATDAAGNKAKDADGNQVVNYGLKTVWKNITKSRAKSQLDSTDWYVTRKAEANTAIPSDISTYRTGVRTASKTIEDKIDACDTFAKFKALFDTPKDSDGKVTGNAPIYDFPKEVS
jgi:hypothetical protein